MNLFLPLGTLESEARRLTGPDGRLREVKLRRLEGGYVAEGVYRVDLHMDLPGGEAAEVSFVQKYAPPRELLVMQALNRETPHASIPRLVDSGTSEGHTWFVYPYFPGEVLSWDDSIPAEVLRMLAQVHWHFERRESEFADVPRVDRSFFRHTFDAGLKALAVQQELFEAEHARLSEIREDERLYAALDSLPLTLTHGDVHSGNLIRAGEDSAVLIDWGNARLVPGALDLANMVEYESPEWAVYLSAWEAAAGRSADRREMELAYRWAEIMVNTQYLPFAVEHLPAENARMMVEKSASALARIAELMGNGRG